MVHVKNAFRNVYYILLSHTTGTGVNIMYTTKIPANPRFLAFSFSQPMSSEYFHLGDGTAMYAESVKNSIKEEKCNISDLKNPRPSNQLTPRSRVLLGNPTVPRQLKSFVNKQQHTDSRPMTFTAHPLTYAFRPYKVIIGVSFYPFT